MNVKIDKKEGHAHLQCRVCGQRFQSTVNRKPLFQSCIPYRSIPMPSVTDLTEPIDVYSAWIDAADAAQKEIDTETRRRFGASGSRPRRAEVSDEE